MITVYILSIDKNGLIFKDIFDDYLRESIQTYSAHKMFDRNRIKILKFYYIWDGETAIINIDHLLADTDRILKRMYAGYL